MGNEAPAMALLEGKRECWPIVNRRVGVQGGHPMEQPHWVI